MMSLAPSEPPRRRKSSYVSTSAVSDGADMSELTEEEDADDEDSYWSVDDGLDGTLRRRYRRARVLVDALLNKLHNGSARAVDPTVARSLQWHESRLMSLRCFVEQGSIDRRRELKGENAIPAPTPTLGISRLLSVCGGYVGPGAVMRQWDQLSSNAAGTAQAMTEYVAIIDGMLPQWDNDERIHPVTGDDCFWQDDAATPQCQYCGALFSSSMWTLHPCRRHHCRLCLAIFCGSCCSQFIMLALCRGAPVRLQRVCRPCFKRAQRDSELAITRKLMVENQALEQQLVDLQDEARRQMDAKRHEEDALRLEANVCGCDMDAIDETIGLRLAHAGGALDSPLGGVSSSSAIIVSLALDTPPAHKFAPARASVEAGEQLNLANRQLQMALRAAQVRSRRALTHMDIILDVLRRAVSAGNGTSGSGDGNSDIWSAVLLRGFPSVSAFLTLRELKTLASTSTRLRDAVMRHKCEAKCVLAQDVTNYLSLGARAALWQAECLRDDKTRAYVTDLADEVRTRLDSTESSSSDEQESGGKRPFQPRWLQLLSERETHSSVWHRTYKLLLGRCELSVMEFDAQIQCDVQRTFGTSAHRRTRPPTKVYNAESPSSPTEPASPPVMATRRTALANVLRAFSCINSEIGYCQGMDHVAALVLSVVDWDEARAFWLLTSLVASRHYELDLLFGPGLPRLNLRCFQLERLVAMHLPKLAEHLIELDFPISMFSTGWFMTLFTNMEALPYDVVVRVLDGFLVAGWKHLFRIALVILESLKHHLIGSTFDEIPQIFYDLQDYAPQLSKPEYVLARAATFKVTNSILKRLQNDYECAETPGRSPVTSCRSSADFEAEKAQPSETLEVPGSPNYKTPSSTKSMSNESAETKCKYSGGGGRSKRARRKSRRRSSSASVGSLDDGESTAKAGGETRGAAPLVDV